LRDFKWFVVGFILLWLCGDEIFAGAYFVYGGGAAWVVEFMIVKLLLPDYEYDPDDEEEW